MDPCGERDQGSAPEPCGSNVFDGTSPEAEQEDRYCHGEHQWPAELDAQGEVGKNEEDDHQRAEPCFGTFQEREWSDREKGEHQDDGEKDEGGRAPMGEVKERSQNPIPTRIVVHLNFRPHQDNFLPGFAGYRFCGITEGVIRREKAETNNAERQVQKDESNYQPCELARARARFVSWQFQECRK